VPRERRGAHAFTRTHLRVAGSDSLAWWEARLREHGVAAHPPMELDGRWTLPFEDPEGQRLALVDDGGAGDPPLPWGGSTVPVTHQLRGLGPIRATVRDPVATETLLQRVLGMRHDRSFEDGGREVRVLAMGDGGPHAELQLEIAPDAEPARPGAGGVHHVAFRIADAEYDAWAARLRQAGVPNSGPVDRFWFRSLYVRDANGLLFELATDGPGFAVDEDPEHLGEKVVLPPFLEPHRQQIEANLKPLS